MAKQLSQCDTWTNIIKDFQKKHNYCDDIIHKRRERCYKGITKQCKPKKTATKTATKTPKKSPKKTTNKAPKKPTNNTPDNSKIFNKQHKKNREYISVKSNNNDTCDINDNTSTTKPIKTNANKSNEQNEETISIQKESKNDDENPNDNNDAINDDECTVTASNVVRAELIGCALSDVCNVVEQQLGIDKKIPQDYIVCRTAYQFGRQQVLSSIGTSIDKKLEDYSIPYVDDFLDKFEISNDWYGFAAKCAIRVGTGLVYGLAKKGVKSAYNAMSQNNNNDESEANNDDNSVWNIANVCVICQNNDVDVVIGFRPCKHILLCKECYDDNNDRLVPGIPCYLCRTRVTHIVTHVS